MLSGRRWKSFTQVKKMKSECILHKQKGNKDGYASTNRKVNGVLRNFLLHRVKFCDFHNIHPDKITGLVIRHTCDNTRCINPLHLISGTPADNAKDRDERNRTAKGENSGAAKLTWVVVRSLRQMSSEGLSYAAISRKTGVNASTVRQVVLKETWNDDEAEADD